MRTPQRLVSLASAFLVAACEQEAGTTYITSGSIDASPANVTAVDRPGDRTAAEPTARRDREEFVRDARTRLDYLDVQIHALEARAPRLASARRAELERELTSLRRARNSLDQDLRRLPDATSQDWTTARSAINAKLDEAERAAVEAAWSSEP